MGLRSGATDDREAAPGLGGSVVEPVMKSRLRQSPQNNSPCRYNEK